METTHINEYTVQFDPANHTYYVNGIKVISVTQMVDYLLEAPYKNVDPEILQKAAQKGIELHDMIENYERHGIKTYHVEMQGYLSLKTQHQLNVLDNEKIVILFKDAIPIAAGRFDMLVQSPYIEGMGLIDVKRMAHLNEARLTLQLNLYKLGFEQTYKQKIHYLKCIHIRGRYRNYVHVPVEREYTKAMIDKYLEDHPIDYTKYY